MYCGIQFKRYWRGTVTISVLASVPSWPPQPALTHSKYCCCTVSTQRYSGHADLSQFQMLGKDPIRKRLHFNFIFLKIGFVFSPGCPATPCVDQANLLTHRNLSVLPPKCWDKTRAPSCPALLTLMNFSSCDSVEVVNDGPTLLFLPFLESACSKRRRW